MTNSDWKLTTPVAVIIFNRPHLARRLFHVLREVKPQTLFIIADAPREGKPDEAELCKAARAVFADIDWDCRVLRNYAETNMGCGQRPATGISWVFEQVPEAIFLEDDCLPHPSFFRFCAELLEHYREDERIAHIGGTNFHPNLNSTVDSYRFSRFPLCWGWASWRRAWQHFDIDMPAWAAMQASGELDQLLDYWLENPAAVRYWRDRFCLTCTQDKTHVWDYQWIFACWWQRALSIYPNTNLVSNIGFGEDATHTMLASATLSPLLQRYGLAPQGKMAHRLAALYEAFSPNRFANLPTDVLNFPLRHPTNMARDIEADAVLQRLNYQGGISGSIKRAFKQMLLR